MTTEEILDLIEVLKHEPLDDLDDYREWDRISGDKQNRSIPPRFKDWTGTAGR